MSESDAPEGTGSGAAAGGIPQLETALKELRATTGEEAIALRARVRLVEQRLDELEQRILGGQSGVRDHPAEAVRAAKGGPGRSATREEGAQVERRLGPKARARRATGGSAQSSKAAKETGAKRARGRAGGSKSDPKDPGPSASGGNGT